MCNEFNEAKAISQLIATAMTMARFPQHHALRYTLSNRSYLNRLRLKLLLRVLLQTPFCSTSDDDVAIHSRQFGHSLNIERFF